MREILIALSWILLITQTFSVTTTGTTRLISTLTSTYQTLTTTISVYPSTVTTRRSNTDDTTYQTTGSYVTGVSTPWPTRATTEASWHTGDTTYRTTERYETSTTTPWTTPPTTTRRSNTDDTTYQTTGSYVTGFSTPWPTRATTEASWHTGDTTYRTTQRYETSGRTSWPIYTTTPYVTHDYSNPSRTTEPADRTNYGTQSTIFWYRTTTMSPPIASDTTTAKTSTDYLTSKESWFPTSRLSTQYDTTSARTTNHVDETDYSKRTTAGWYPTTGRVSSSRPNSWDNFEKIITVEPFKNVMIRLAKDVVLRSSTKSSGYQVKFSCPTNMLDFLVTESHDDTLFVTAFGDCDMEIQGDQFERLDIGSVRSISTVNYLNGTHLSIITGEAAAINLTSIHYDSVAVMLFGDSDVALQGSTRVLDVTQLGTGTFDGERLNNHVARVLSRHHGLVRVKSTDALSLFINESANIIWCSPEIEIKTNGFDWWNSPHITQNCD